MSITFLNPLLLFGLAAGILPILIHRLTQRKAVRRNFSAVRLLLHSQNVMARPQRLKHLVLLALRVLAVIALVLMAAQPLLVRPGLLARGEDGSKVLVIDNSMSMGFTETQEVRYERAKKVAQEIIGGLKGEVLIIPTAPVQGKRLEEKELRWMRPADALKELSSIPLSFGRGDPGTTVMLACQKLKDVKNANEIVVVSDMAKGDWQGFDPGKLGVIPANTSITFLRVGPNTRDANAGVKGVSLSEGEVMVGTPFRLEVTVSNLSDQPVSTVVQISVGDVKVDQKSIELKAREDGKVSFELLLDRAGWVNGQVRLSGDNLPYDDLFYFPLKVRDKIKVLLVDGDPRASIRAGESYYLTRALRPGDSEESPFQVMVITDREFSAIDAGPYEALFLLNVAKPEPSKIAAFLDAAKPVFIFLGDRVNSEAYNGMPLFPWRLREIKEATARRLDRIAQVDYRYEALKDFSRKGEKSLEGASFSRYYKIEGGGKTLLALENKDPLLLEAAVGKGRMLLYASSADLDWNDLALKAAYVPLIQGLVKEAVGSMRSSLPPDMKVGEPFDKNVRPIQITGVQGGPGIYQFFKSSGEVRLALNTPLEESDLGKRIDDEIGKQLSGMQVKVVEYKEGSPNQVRGGRQDLWPYFLGFLLLVLAVELGVANKL
jgi:hypothetical protein